MVTLNALLDLTLVMHQKDYLDSNLYPLINWGGDIHLVVERLSEIIYLVIESYLNPTR